MARLKERAAKEEKRRRHAREDFTALLKDSREIKPDTTWEDAQPLLEKHPEYKAVSSCRPLCHDVVLRFSNFSPVAVRALLWSRQCG